MKIVYPILLIACSFAMLTEGCLLADSEWAAYKIVNGLPTSQVIISHGSLSTPNKILGYTSVHDTAMVLVIGYGSTGKALTGFSSSHRPIYSPLLIGPAGHVAILSSTLPLSQAANTSGIGK